jgi:hypothetical protein
MIPARKIRLYPQQWKQDPAKSANILKWQDGPITNQDGDSTRSVVVDGSKLTFDMEHAYPDDVMAAARDLILALDPELKNDNNREAVRHMNEAIYNMDIRARMNHNYKGNKAEHLEVPYDIEEYQFSKQDK